MADKNPPYDPEHIEAHQSTSDKLFYSDLIDMSPVTGNEKQPWNPDCYIYQMAVNHYLPDSDQKVLNLACTTGTTAIRLATLGYEVHGFDNNPSDIDWAIEQALRHGLKDSCHFRVMDALLLDYADNTFDVITGFDVLGQTHQSINVQEINRVLKPGGMAIFRQQIQTPSQKPVEQSTQDPASSFTDQDLAAIEQIFDRVQVKKFTVLGRLNRLIPRNSESTRLALQKIDHKLLQLCPPLSAFSSTAVLICHKRSKTAIDDILFAA